MNSSSTIKAESFSAHYEAKGNQMIVWMRGNADMAVHERVKAFLDALDQAARAAGAKEAVFELGELYFMNSSGLSLLLRFINGIVSLTAAQAYQVRFRSHRNLRGPKRS